MKQKINPQKRKQRRQERAWKLVQLLAKEQGAWDGKTGRYSTLWQVEEWVERELKKREGKDE